MPMTDKNTFTIHINDAIVAYNKIKHRDTPDYAKEFNTAMIQNVIGAINGTGNKRLIKLTHEQHKSYLSILNTL